MSPAGLRMLPNRQSSRASCHQRPYHLERGDLPMDSPIWLWHCEQLSLGNRAHVRRSITHRYYHSRTISRLQCLLSNIPVNLPFLGSLFQLSTGRSRIRGDDSIYLSGCFPICGRLSHSMFKQEDHIPQMSREVAVSKYSA